MKLKSFLPILNWLPKYSTDQFKGDAAAGLTVGVMLIPQGMAYAMLAGLPPIYGLYASTLPLILYAILGTSRQLAVGPVAMVSLLTASSIGMLAETGSASYIALAISLALVVGLIQFFLGAFRLGFLVNFLSHPVISGFTSAAALIIGISQLKHLLGVSIGRSHHIHEILLEAFEKIGSVSIPTLLIGLGGIALIIIVRKLNRSIPGSLLAVLFGILVSWGFGMTESGVKIVGDVPQGLPSFGIPSLSFDMLGTLLPIALTISLVSFMESIAVAKAVQAKHKNYKVIPNQELIALGAANIGGAFFQAYPVTGGFSRTAVNDQAGAQTGMASMISAVLIILTLLFLTPLFYYLPNAILAAVIMVAVFGLIDYKEPIHLWHTDRGDFWMLIVTFVATLSLGIEQGIGIGVILSLSMMIFRTTRPHMAELGQVPGAKVYRNLERFPNLEKREDILIVRFDSQLYFANINYFQDRMREMIRAKGDQLKAIVINSESIGYVDSSALHALEEFVKKYGDRNIKIYFTGLIGPVRDALTRANLLNEIGKNRLFMTVQQAVDMIDGEGQPDALNGRLENYTLQTNE